MVEVEPGDQYQMTHFHGSPNHQSPQPSNVIMATPYVKKSPPILSASTQPSLHSMNQQPSISAVVHSSRHERTKSQHKMASRHHHDSGEAEDDNDDDIDEDEEEPMEDEVDIDEEEEPTSVESLAATAAAVDKKHYRKLPIIRTPLDGGSGGTGVMSSPGGGGVVQSGGTSGRFIGRE